MYFVCNPHMCIKLEYRYINLCVTIRAQNSGTKEDSSQYTNKTLQYTLLKEAKNACTKMIYHSTGSLYGIILSYRHLQCEHLVSILNSTYKPKVQ